MDVLWSLCVLLLDRAVLHRHPGCFSLQVVQYYLATWLPHLIFDTPQPSVKSAASYGKQVSRNKRVHKVLSDVIVI